MHNRKTILQYIMYLLPMIGGLATGFIYSHFFTESQADKESLYLKDIDRRARILIKKKTQDEVSPKQIPFSNRLLLALLARLDTKSSTELLQQEWETLLPYEQNENKLLAMHHILVLWASKKPEEALRHVDQLTGYLGSKKGDFKTTILGEWSVYHPNASANYYKEHRKELFTQSELLKKISTNWSKSSPSEAWEWFKGLNLPEQAKCINSFFESIAENHPEKMTEFASQISLPSKNIFYTPRNLADLFTEKWYPIDPYAAQKWLQSLDENQQTMISPQILSMVTLYKNNTEEFERQILDLSLEDQQNVISRVGDYIINKSSFEDAIVWLDKVNIQLQNHNFGKTEHKISIYSNIERLSDYYPLETKQWIKSLPEGDLKDDAISAYIKKVASPFPEEMQSLVEQIKNSTKRKQAKELIREI